MELRTWVKEHKKGAAALAVVAVLGIGAAGVGVAGYSRMSEGKSDVVKAESEEKKELFSSVKGIKDLYVEQNAKEINWLREVSSNKRIKVTADDKKVDLTKPGKYELIYTATVLGEEEKQVKKVTVTVVDNKEAQKLADEGKTVWMSKNQVKAVTKKQEAVKKEEKKQEPKQEKITTAKAEQKEELKQQTVQEETKVQEEFPQPEQENNSSVNKQESDQSPAPQPEKPSQPEKKPVWHDPVYEKKWVVDQAAWDETISEPIYEMVEKSICNGCLADITGNPWGHIDAALDAGNFNCGGYHSEWVQEQTGTNTHTVHHDEVGHWEEVLVQEGYWE